MGGLGPGIGGFELFVIVVLTLIVVRPENLPAMMRKIGEFVGGMRRMANEFRASFDEMARQSELDDLRKEVEALRKGQGLYPLGEDADKAFREISQDLNEAGRAIHTPAPALGTPDGGDAAPPAPLPAPSEDAPVVPKPSTGAASPTPARSAAKKPAAKKSGPRKPASEKPTASRSSSKAAPARRAARPTRKAPAGDGGAGS
ncbi:MAG: Sec-independent protein translocase protein TatB [Brevundimonas sp.]|jgi:sec-independent protein translocase protein TatB|uniref:Sec-independent protein translocase protein TatB n=1 Tax=Brevundimonas sp. TaxID=1871086 RepID=UPI003918FD98